MSFVDQATGKREWWANVPDGDAFMRLTHRQLRLAITLRGFPSSKEGTAWASWATLAGRSRMDVRKVRAIAGQLRDMGWLEWDERPGTTNLYRLLAPLGCATTAQGGCATVAQGGGAPPRRTEQSSTERSRGTLDVPVQGSGHQPSASAKERPRPDHMPLILGDGFDVAAPLPAPAESLDALDAEYLRRMSMVPGIDDDTRDARRARDTMRRWHTAESRRVPDVQLRKENA